MPQHLPNSNEGIAHAEGIFVVNAALGFVPHPEKESEHES
jgi:hypothetical protein